MSVAVEIGHLQAVSSAKGYAAGKGFVIDEMLLPRNVTAAGIARFYHLVRHGERALAAGTARGQ